MNVTPLRVLALLWLGASGLPAAETLAVPFRSGSFEEARAAAAAEKKVVFIDFYTTWCGPCKMLDKSTWTDPAVGRLVGENAVALKLDAEKETALAARYKINAYPTLLILKPDGSEVDRIVGYREPAQFIPAFTSALAGKTSLMTAQEKVNQAGAGSHDAVQARYDFGRQLAQSGRYAEALQQYLWCYDEGMVKSPSFSGVRLSFLPMSIARLGKEYAPALDALRSRRDAATEAFLLDENPKSAGRELSALNDALGENDSTIALLETIPADDKRRRSFGYSVYRALVAKKRYADALSVFPYSSMLLSFQTTSTMGIRRSADPETAAVERHMMAGFAIEHVQVLAGVGDVAHAQQLGDKILAFDNSPETRAGLVKAAGEAGHPELWAAPPAGKSL